MKKAKDFTTDFLVGSAMLVVGGGILYLLTHSEVGIAIFGIGVFVLLCLAFLGMGIGPNKE